MLAKASQFSLLFPGNFFFYLIKQDLPSYLLKKSPIGFRSHRTN